MPLFVFDAYGTLFDVHAAIRQYSTGPDADRMSEIWRAKQLEYTWTLTLAGHYADLSTPERSCIGSPERKYINDSGKKAPELGGFS